MSELAKQMWGAYAIQAGGKTFDGKPLPNWDELGEDRQACWAAAAKVSADRIEQLEAALRAYYRYVCPTCGGLCAVSTPIVQNCPEHLARAALEGKDG